MQDQKTLRIGLFGVGIWGQKVLRDLVSLGAEVWIFEISENNRKLSEELGASRFSINWPETDLPDAWIVATPAITHFVILKRLFLTKLPIFVEKPLTCNYQEALELAKIATAPTFVMHNWRYHAGIRMLAGLAKSKELGDLVFFKSNRCNWTSPRSDVDSIWTLIPHDITIALSILGEMPFPVAAQVEEYGGVARGMTAFLGRNPACVLEVSNRYSDKRREVRLHFTKGVAVLKNETVDFIEISHGDDKTTPAEMRIEQRKFEVIPPLYEELRIFLEFLRGGPPPISDLIEGIEVIRVIDELKKLAKA
jgi:predicted dehydrogenase